MFNSYPFREYITVFKRSTDVPFGFATVYFPLSNLTNRASVIFDAVVTNQGDNDVSFKLQSGTMDTSNTTVTVFSDANDQDANAASYTVTPGGQVYIKMKLTGGVNALQFVLTSSDASTLMFSGTASADPIFLFTNEKDYTRESFGLTTWDASQSAVTVTEPSDQWSNAPAAHAFLITPSTTALEHETRAIIVGGSGDLVADFAGGETNVTIPVPVGQWALRLTKVYPATSATDLVGLW